MRLRKWDCGGWGGGEEESGPVASLQEVDEFGGGVVGGLFGREKKGKGRWRVEKREGEMYLLCKLLFFV